MTDGVLLMAYGTPRRREEIGAYYTDIRRGRSPTPELLAELTARYDAIGGLSPLRQRTEAQQAVLQQALDQRAPGELEVVLGFKHAEPTIEAGVAELASRGRSRVVALVLAPHYSALSVGQYLERATAAGAGSGVQVIGIESWYTEPAYLDFCAAAVSAALAALPPRTTVVFTAHSLPQRILATGDPYPEQLAETAAAVVDRVGLASSNRWAVAWQSAGRTPEPWLGPDILTVIDDLATQGASGLLVCPCGFVADHLEVLYDLDIEARRRAATAGLAFARTPVVNTDPEVMAALADRVRRVVAAPGRAPIYP